MTASSSATWLLDIRNFPLQMPDNAKGNCGFTRLNQWRFGREKASLQSVPAGCQIGTLVARNPAALLPNCRIIARF